MFFFVQVAESLFEQFFEIEQETEFHWGVINATGLKSVNKCMYLYELNQISN